MGCLLFNLVELVPLNSLSAGRFARHNALRAKQATMTEQDLLAHRGYIRRLYERLATERNRE